MAGKEIRMEKIQQTGVGMEQTRYRYLDIARGIGILLVIISHAHGLSSYLINYYIPIFFVISGFTYHSGRSYLENIVKKAKRLLIPYFVYSFVLLGVYMLLGRSMEETRFSLFGIFYSRFCLYDMSTHTDNVFLFTIANGAMWYLTAFFVTSLVFHLVADFALKSKKNLILVLAALLAVTMALAELPVLLPWSLDIACVGTIFMLVGKLLAQSGFYEGTPKSWRVACVFAAYMLMSYANPGINMSVREYGVYERWSVPAFILIGISGSMLCIWAAQLLYMLMSYANPGINMSVREYGVYERWSVPAFILIGISGSMLCIWAAQLLSRTHLGRAVEYIGKNTIILMAFHILGLEIFEMLAAKVIDVAALGGATKALYVIVRVSASVCGCLVFAKGLDWIKGALGKEYDHSDGIPYSWTGDF